MRLRELLRIIQAVQEKAETSKIWLVGGVPRDRLLGRANDLSDLDFSTGDKTVHILAKEVAILLGKHFDIKTKIMDDGHISIFFGDIKLDFSSNFMVPNITEILNKMGIEHPTNIQKEFFSRDFTCNSLLMSLDLNKFLDPTRLGIQDIKQKIIRTCLSPEITLTSNKNRVIRAIYLAAKLGFEIEPLLMEWIKKHPDSIKFSTEHTLSEKLNKAMEYDPDRTTYLLDKMGLWQQIPISQEMYPYYRKRMAAEVVI